MEFFFSILLIFAIIILFLLLYLILTYCSFSSFLKCLCHWFPAWVSLKFCSKKYLIYIPNVLMGCIFISTKVHISNFHFGYLGDYYLIFKFKKLSFYYCFLIVLFKSISFWVFLCLSCQPKRHMLKFLSNMLIYLLVLFLSICFIYFLACMTKFIVIHRTN